MEGISQVIAYAAWTVVKFVGLTVITAVSLFLCVLINSMAITFMQSWLPMPGFFDQNSSFPVLDFVFRFFGFGGF